MKLKVVGPRILVKVTKFSAKKEQTFEGSSILMPEAVKEMETTGQTTGEVVQIGDTAYMRKDSGCNNKAWVKEGDRVHFSRYGAVRIKPKDSEDVEYWVLMDKDVLAIEEA